MKDKQKGMLSIMAAAFFFAAMNVFVKLSGDLPAPQKSFFRNLIAMIFAFMIQMRSGEKLSYRKKDLPMLLMRSIFGTIGILCNFYAVDHLLVSDASMLNKLSPFFVIIFSVFILKERVTLFQICAVIVAFIGALFVIKPGAGLSSQFFASMVGVAGGLGAGIAYTMVRLCGKRGAKGPQIVFFFSGFSCLVVCPYIIFCYHPMSVLQIASLVTAGICAAIAQFSITAAYSNAPAKEISIYDYSQLLFAAIWGFVIFGNIPDYLSIIGYVIICGSSAAMFFYNNRKLHTEG